MKKYAFFVCTLLFLVLQCISLNHQYDSEHFFVHDNTCAQCQFMQQTGNAQVPDIIELSEADCQYSEIPLADSPLVLTAYFDSYLAQAPPSLI